MRQTLRIAARGSALARWQAANVAVALKNVNPGLTVEMVTVSTKGDRLAETPVAAMGGQGVFVTDVQQALLDGSADLAVHSAKDLPSVTAEGLALVAVPPRGDPRDALVGSSLMELPEGAVIATGSQRRQAQLAALRPDLSFVGLRGNIETRLSKVPVGGAVVVAAAALIRLGLHLDNVDVLPTSVMLPQVAQGALGVECRQGDEEVITMVAPIEDAGTRAEIDAERAFLAALGGGCDVPVGAHASRDGDHLMLEGMVAALDGRCVIRERLRGPAEDPKSLGARLAQSLMSQGGKELLSGSGRSEL